MDINIRVHGFEKLVDYAASGIGSTAGHLFAAWIARRQVEARLIAAVGEVQAQRVLAEGQATTTQIIATAQAGARSILVSPQAVVQGEVSFGDMVSQRIQFQEEKRQSNIDAVVSQAALELGDKDVPDHEPDHDWTARFFSEVQDVSSEGMQSLWSKVLAGEVEKPGSTSIQTLSLLRNLNQATAALFRTLCSACISVRLDGNNVLEARVPSLGSNAEGNALKEYGLGFGSLNVLNEHGLIISDYNSWRDYRSAIGISVSPAPSVMRIPFSFQSSYWVLVPTSQRDFSKDFRVSGVSLTQSGRELSRIVELEPKNEFAQDLIKFFEAQNLQMTEVVSWEPQTVLDSSPSPPAP